MTQIFAVDIQPDSVVLLDGSPYFIDDTRSIDEGNETVAYLLRAVYPGGLLSDTAALRRFDFEDMVTLKG